MQLTMMRTSAAAASARHHAGLRAAPCRARAQVLPRRSTIRRFKEGEVGCGLHQEGCCWLCFSWRLRGRAPALVAGPQSAHPHPHKTR
jgi:hypothetical protein